jgi:hypothetical protein
VALRVAQHCQPTVLMNCNSVTRSGCFRPGTSATMFVTVLVYVPYVRLRIDDKLTTTSISSLSTVRYLPRKDSGCLAVAPFRLCDWTRGPTCVGVPAVPAVQGSYQIGSHISPTARSVPACKDVSLDARSLEKIGRSGRSRRPIDSGGGRGGGVFRKAGKWRKRAQVWFPYKHPHSAIDRSGASKVCRS